MGPRIVHVISSRGIGGAERFLAALVEHGGAHGWEQSVLNPFATDASAPLGAICDPVPVLARRCDGPLDLPTTRRWLGAELARFRPEVVHVLLFHALVAVATLPAPPGSRRVATNVYGDWVTTAPHGWLVRAADRWAGRRVDHVAAISESVARFLVSEYRYPSSKVTCIPLGWKGAPLPRSTAPRPPTIISVGGLRPEKGHDVLLAALALVHEEVPAARLVVVGDGELRPSLEAQAAAGGMGDRVEFLGSIPEVWPLLAGADVFASASRSEAFGIAIAEAMAAGLPVVAPAVGAIPELVVPGVTGELFPPGDHRALAGHLARMLRSAELRARMGTAARQAADGLRMERAVERYFDLFDDVRAGATSDAATSGDDGRAAGAS
jgi:glycosyltransferase involved in cell wall biosynthesis